MDSTPEVSYSDELGLKDPSGYFNILTASLLTSRLLLILANWR